MPEHYVPNMDELAYVAHHVFPTERSVEIRRDRRLIHYRPEVPVYGQSVHVDDVIVPDFEGNNPGEFFLPSRQSAIYRPAAATAATLRSPAPSSSGTNSGPTSPVRNYALHEVEQPPQPQPQSQAAAAPDDDDDGALVHEASTDDVLDSAPAVDAEPEEPADGQPEQEHEARAVRTSVTLHTIDVVEVAVGGLAERKDTADEEGVRTPPSTPKNDPEATPRAHTAASDLRRQSEQLVAEVVQHLSVETASDGKPEPDAAETVQQETAEDEGANSVTVVELTECTAETVELTPADKEPAEESGENKELAGAVAEKETLTVSVVTTHSGNRKDRKNTSEIQTSVMEQLDQVIDSAEEEGGAGEEADRSEHDGEAAEESTPIRAKIMLGLAAAGATDIVGAGAPAEAELVAPDAAEPEATATEAAQRDTSTSTSNGQLVAVPPAPAAAALLADIPTHYENSGNAIPEWQRRIMAQKRAEQLVADEEARLMCRPKADGSAERRGSQSEIGGS